MGSTVLQKIKLSALITTIVISESFSQGIINTQVDKTIVEISPYAIAYYDANDSFIISSLTRGQLGMVNNKGEYKVLCDDSKLTSYTTWGLTIQNNLARVCIGPSRLSLNNLKKSTVAKVATIDLNTGNYLNDIDLTRLKPNGSLGSIATSIASDNHNADLYVTDMIAGAIYKITSAGQSTLFTHDNLFKGSTSQEKASDGSLGITGIAISDSCILVSNYTKGQIIRVSMDAKKIIPVEIDKPFNFVGITDLIFNKTGSLIAINNRTNCIYELKSTDNWRTASVVAINPTDYRGPIGGVLVNDKIFILTNKKPTYTITPYIRQLNHSLLDKDSSEVNDN